MAEQLARELKADVDGGLLRPPWRYDPYKNIEQSFQQLLDGLGYEEEAALVQYLKTHERRSYATPLQRKSSAPSRMRGDVFACLRSNCACGDRLSTGRRDFCVKHWEREASKEYIAAVGGKFPARRKRSRTNSTVSIDSANDVRQLAKGNVVDIRLPALAHNVVGPTCCIGQRQHFIARPH